MKNHCDQKCSVELPKDLAFAADYSQHCTNCQWMNGGRGEEIWCDYYKSYYDPREGYNCNKFLKR